MTDHGSTYEYVVLIRKLLAATGRRADMGEIREAIYQIVEKFEPMTVRQVFYQLVSCGIFDKLESEYNSTVCRLLTEMRKAGQLPFDWIADNTRWQRKPRTYESLEEMLELTQETYRRALWGNQGTHVEIWLEKEALSGILYSVTSKWDVPLYTTRGYPSLSYLYSAAEYIIATDKPAVIYYFGDYDPSGVDISRHTEESLRQYVDVDLTFTPVAAR